MASHTTTLPRNRLPSPINKSDITRVFDNWGDLRYVDGKGWYAHGGIDVSCPAGTPIYFPATSEVIALIEAHRTWGNRVDLRITEGPYKGDLYAFSHCLKPIEFVVGGVVKKKQLAGYVGNTGNSSGPHLDLMHGSNLGPNGYAAHSGSATTRGFVDGVSIYCFEGCRWS